MLKHLDGNRCLQCRERKAIDKAKSSIGLEDISATFGLRHSRLPKKEAAAYELV